MNSKWTTARLKDLALINRESYSRSDGWDFVNYLDTGSITKGVIDKITLIDLRHEKLPSRARRKVAPYDIIYSTVRPNQEHYGIIRHPVANMLVSTGFVTITAKEGVDAQYLYYYLSQPQITTYLHAIAEQRVSTYPALNVSDLEELPITVPPLRIQQEIGEMLSCLDAKIALNKRINENLEEQAQAIFKSWFVDFEPFQDSDFVESQYGWIPQGWRLGRLGEFIEVTSGKRPIVKTNQRTPNNKVPVIGASRVMGYTNESLFDDRVLVIGRVGTHGVVQRIDFPCWPSDNTLVIKSQFYEFAYQVLKRIDYSSINRGSTQPLITQRDLRNQVIVVPPEFVLRRYEDVASSLLEVVRNNLRENQTLSSLRDTLLPKLMSGEIEVPIV